MHHEVELGVVIGKNGRDIPKSEAESYIAGYSESLFALSWAFTTHVGHKRRYEVSSLSAGLSDWCRSKTGSAQHDQCYAAVVSGSGEGASTHEQPSLWI